MDIQKRKFFFEQYGLNEADLERYLGAALSAGGEYADLYFEYLSSTSISMDESLVKSASQGISAGCGVRVISGERTGYAYTDDLAPEKLLRAARTAALIASGPAKQAVANLKEHGQQNLYPANTLSVHADISARLAIVQLDAREAPAGEMEVVLRPGWPGVLLHEAIGHGLEADFNRKKTSAFSGLIGKKVAGDKCTVVDDGSMPSRRGSINVDDEGAATQKTVLIENGILKGYLSDKLSARLMGIHNTGNGRRESYEHIPMPRMTNTYMLAGTDAPEDIIRSVKRGVFAANFGGGQVDITSGKFVFSASEAYLIEDGQITAPLRNATLIGNGPDALTKVSMVGNDLQLDEGIGTCGKEGQSVPVGVGIPTIKVDRMTVGGTGG